MLIDRSQGEIDLDVDIVWKHEPKEPWSVRFTKWECYCVMAPYKVSYSHVMRRVYRGVV